MAEVGEGTTIGEPQDWEAYETVRLDLEALPNAAQIGALVQRNGQAFAERRVGQWIVGRARKSRNTAAERRHAMAGQRLHQDGEPRSRRARAGIAPMHAGTTPARRRGRKRADGEGTISQHASSGMWRGRLMVGRTPDGQPDVREVYAKTQAGCRKKLDALKGRLASGTLLEAAKDRDSLAAFAGRWLDAKRHTLRPRTHQRYEQLLRRHVLPRFGTVRLAQLAPDELERLYAAKLGEGLAPRTVHHIHTVLHTALEQAVQWGYVARNVADAVTPPSVPRPELCVPTSQEVGRLLDVAALVKDRLQALWTLAAFTGCRLGELLALTWEHVDLATGTIAVRRVLVDVKARQPIWGEPKTKRSRRDVELPEGAVTALRAHRDRQRLEREQLGDDYGGYGLVFATQLGTPLQRKVVQEAFKRALVRAELPRAIRFHDLRHAAASLMLANGEDVPTVAAVLGHSQNSTTLNIYAHAVPEKVRRATSSIERAVRTAAGGS